MAENLQEMKTGEVMQKAREAGIENVEGKNKQELIDELGSGAPASAQPGHGGGRGDTPAPAGTSPEDWKNVPGNQS